MIKFVLSVLADFDHWRIYREVKEYFYPDCISVKC